MVLLALSIQGLFHLSRFHKYKETPEDYIVRSGIDGGIFLCKERNAASSSGPRYLPNLYDPIKHQRVTMCPICLRKAQETNKIEGVCLVIPGNLPDV
jgi:hypothetical protein